MTCKEMKLTDPVARASLGRSGVAPKGLFDSVGAGVARVFDLLLLWQERSTQRVRLGQLDDHLLHDLGLDRDQVAREVGKPFWRA